LERKLLKSQGGIHPAIELIMTTDASSSSARLPVVVVRAAAMLCALPLASVIETLRCPPLTAVSEAPACVAGVAMIRGMGDLAALARAQTVMPIPSADLALLGLAGLKGRLVAVYSLAATIGSPALNTEPERWLVLCRNEDRIALAFTAAEGTLMVPSSELYPVSQGAPPHATDAVGVGAARDGYGCST
jgi:chemotaxis signal transduction protein